jgi:hypothetical protein
LRRVIAVGAGVAGALTVSSTPAAAVASTSAPECVLDLTVED